MVCRLRLWRASSFDSALFVTIPSVHRAIPLKLDLPAKPAEAGRPWDAPVAMREESLPGCCREGATLPGSFVEIESKV